MIYDKPKISPLGENALIVSFGSEISAELNEKVLNFAANVEKNTFVGFIEIVPAYDSCAIFYDVFQIYKYYGDFFSAFQTVKNYVEDLLNNLENVQNRKSELLEIPVSFDKNHALDLDFVAQTNDLTAKEVIKIFTNRTYCVFMLGFLPGFAYMGELDEKISAPRKQQPRIKVPKGSVGIAGRQTGIYSLRSPGGWQIIGKTDVELFTPNNDKPTLFQAGDSVKFISV